MNSKNMSRKNSKSKKKLTIIRNDKENDKKQHSLTKNHFSTKKSIQKLRQKEEKEIVFSTMQSEIRTKISFSLPSVKKVDQMQKSHCCLSRMPSTSSTTSTTLKPSFFLLNGKLQNCKIEDILNKFIANFIQNGIIHKHFDKYLIEPKDYYQILLFNINSFNNCNNLLSFKRTILSQQIYNRFTHEMQNNNFKFAFGKKNNHRLKLSFQTINLQIENEYRINLQKNATRLENNEQRIMDSINTKNKQKSMIESDIEMFDNIRKHLQLKVQKLNSQLQSINDKIHRQKEQILKNERVIKQIDSKKTSFYSFLNNFNQKNYIDVAISMKKQEEILLQYVKYLQYYTCCKNNQIKSTKIKYNIDKFILKKIEQIQPNLLDGHLPFEQKSNNIFNVMQTIKQQHNKHINQVFRIISDKTQHICKLTNMVTKWQQAYSNKKVILRELNKSLEIQIFKLQEMMKEQSKLKSKDKACTNFLNTIDLIVHAFNILQSDFL